MTTSPSHPRRSVVLGIAGTLAAPAIVRAQTRWKPERPISIYNPFAAGGATDLHLRFLAEKASKILGQQVIIEVKAGAAGTLAPAQLLSARPDGHALACMSINSLRYPHYQQVSWHPLRDFTYITGLSGYTIGIVVRSDAPWKTIEDLIAAGKREPEKYTYGTSGVGGSGQLMMIEVDQVTGAKFTHVPYKGGAEWMPALMGGHVHFLADAAQWAPFVDQGQCRILAMATEQRIPKYPDAPTLRERGINAVAQSPYGLVGPKDLPPHIAQTLHEVFTEATNDPGMQPILDRYIQVPWRKNPAEFRAYAESYFNSVKPLLIKAGLAKA
ncbi:MAG TPA: tripartite tricarboxylate transporter substrate binding protein [Burkholderiaceae bacterium]|jgi:tripartite-type tricarboxylate transporter receptor subunit TctC|nr:tripartite tricarboxylate transporter substrate binding protein [Burkholderiaceae bacterium]